LFTVLCLLQRVVLLSPDPATGLISLHQYTISTALTSISLTHSLPLPCAVGTLLQRVVLLSVDPATDPISLRHYTISAALAHILHLAACLLACPVLAAACGAVVG
jgi:hypothetical protein